MKIFMTVAHDYFLLAYLHDLTGLAYGNETIRHLLYSSLYTNNYKCTTYWTDLFVSSAVV